MSTAALKVVVFMAALLPAARLVQLALTGGDLTANPIEYLLHQTGWFTLFFLTTTLAITPLRRATGWHPVIRFRRMVGLFAFFYASVHLLIWTVLDRVADVPMMLDDVMKRPYITVGMAGFLMLCPLAVTSTAGWIRRLGGRRWQRLHQLVYVAAIAGVVHFWWLVKSDIREPLRFGLVVAGLLGARVWWTWRATRLSRS